MPPSAVGTLAAMGAANAASQAAVESCA
jgi:hypothetical protein